MGGMFSAPKAPAAPVPQDTGAVDAEERRAEERSRQAMAAAQGRSSLINPLTGSQGGSDAPLNPRDLYRLY